MRCERSGTSANPYASLDLSSLKNCLPTKLLKLKGGGLNVGNRVGWSDTNSNSRPQGKDGLLVVLVVVVAD